MWVQSSGSQPGVRVPSGVREKSQWVPLIFISLGFTQRFSMKMPLHNSQGVREISFSSFGIRVDEGGEPLV